MFSHSILITQTRFQTASICWGLCRCPSIRFIHHFHYINWITWLIAFRISTPQCVLFSGPLPTGGIVIVCMWNMWRAALMLEVKKAGHCIVFLGHTHTANAASSLIANMREATTKPQLHLEMMDRLLHQSRSQHCCLLLHLFLHSRTRTSVRAFLSCYYRTEN
jgi:hypothetical protein